MTEELKRLFEARGKGRKDFSNESKRQLSDSLEKYISSVMIGSLAAVEEELGYLWSHGEDVELTPEQLQVKQDFVDARKRILDNGNKYIRQMKDSLDDYYIMRDRYDVKLSMVNKEG